MHQSCFLEIGISQVWVDGFQISQSLWVREALGHILNLSRRHNSCKQNFCVTKSPKIHLFFQFHITGTVHSIFTTTHFISITQMKQSICGKSTEIPNNQFTITNSNTTTTISKRLQLVRKLIFQHFSIFQNEFPLSVSHNGRF